MPRITDSQLCGRDNAPLVTLVATLKYESFKENVKVKEMTQFGHAFLTFSFDLVWIG